MGRLRTPAPIYGETLVPRNPRYVEPNSLVEVTVRCTQGRYLLRPSPELNETFIGVLGRAQEKTGLRLVGTVAMSSHYYLLAVPKDQKQLSRFMCFVNGNLSKEIGRLHGWPGTLWESRYHSIPVDKDEATQVARLRYLLSQGVKEDLVERPEEWPGVHCARALSEGTELLGKWCDRTKLYRQRVIEKKDVTEEDCTEEVALRFSPLPCWQHYPPEKYQEEVRMLVQKMVDQASQRRSYSEEIVLGAQGVMEEDPHHLPTQRKRSTAPLFHASSSATYKLLYKAFSAVYAAYRLAAEKLRAGFTDVEYPEGTFPCSLPFVPFECRGDLA